MQPRLDTQSPFKSVDSPDSTNIVADDLEDSV